MRLLLIDNSNTRTKLTLSLPGGAFQHTCWIPTADVSPEALETTLGNLSFDGAVICSVVPEKSRILHDFLAPRVPVHHLTAESPLEIGIDYPEPDRIGADRLANAVGVVARHQAPAVVIDFGTAVTFDVVSAAPSYLGGVIAPGLGAMGEYLGRKTALLPLIDLEEPAHAIGRSTVEAMRAGAVIGYRGLVREILASIRRELPGDAIAVATGGDAALIARGVPEIQRVDSELTLHGIELVGRRHFGALP
ncbi:type III pantothenate kinase [Haloferula luteola]|uniref:Type III pantothenate kinase n=1 Tax=Haloferula luteola TaxID=595692 RepID=A0A840VH17_9BACT|nr:type III pantothenate kinase [Haloferula luteola]MBB5353130.1 type III pantothenate kinase [Haloferula luteola]